MIGVKPILNGKGHPSSSSTSPLPTPTRGTFGQIALPGLSMARSGADKLEDRAPSSPAPAKEPLQEWHSGERKFGADILQQRHPPVPYKPSRIPSTGNRATVMDVAQVWSQHEKQSSQDVGSPQPASPDRSFEPHLVQPAGTQVGLDHQRGLDREKEGEREKQEQGEPLKVNVRSAIAGCGIQASAPASSTVETPRKPKEKDTPLKLPDLLSPVEKRKSSWEKYSELIMPPLEEEWTPVPSPTPTWHQLREVPAEPKEPVAAPIPGTKRFEESKVDYLPIDLLSTILNPEREIIEVASTDLITFGKRIRFSFVLELMSC